MKNKKIFSYGLITLCILFSVFTRAQTASKLLKVSEHSRSFGINEFVVSTPQASKTTAMANCTDKINYVGNTPTYFIEMGGPGDPITGIYQSFYNYEGNITGVEFDAAKSPTAAGNPVVYVRIYDSNVSPLIATPLSPAVAVTLTNTTIQTYSITFATPVTITGNDGFAVGIVNSNTSNRPRIQLGPYQTSATNNWSWVSDVSGGDYAYNLSNYFSSPAINALIRPTVTTTVNPVWSVSKASAGCTFPAVYDFINNSPQPSTYVGTAMINPLGITSELDLGDGSSLITQFGGANHTYTNVGNYVASYKETYLGWTTNCVQTLTSNIIVENPIPLFTYTVNGFNVNFTNSSSGLTNYMWDFGDLSTSSQQNPGNHTYATEGVYVATLTSTASCGQVSYTVSFLVGTSGINENKINTLLTIYPNPVNDQLTIQNNKTNFDQKIEIYNSLGALVKTVYPIESGSANIKIDVSPFLKGVYFIKLKEKNNSVVKSFVKE